MRTWKIDGPPEMVEGMVMKVMTSCSLRPASRARNPPMACIPSCELPAIRITVSLTVAMLGVLSGRSALGEALLIQCFFQFLSWLKAKKQLFARHQTE